MEAVQYSNRVSGLVQELNDLYNQAQGLCRGLENRLNGFQQIRVPAAKEQQYYRELEQFKLQYPELYLVGGLPYRENKFEEIRRIATFSEQMEITRVYLKCLGGRQPSDILTDQENRIFGNANLMERLVWYFMADHLEAYVRWLKDVIDECDRMLQIQYQPGGELFQQVQERNVGRYGIGL